MIFRQQWKIRVPWGNLILLRWGRPDGKPVFLVHGRQDSSSVFIPLLKQMPPHYNYVALDMPGNGLSDPFPKAPVFHPRPQHYAVLLRAPPAPRQPFIDYYSKQPLYYNKRGRWGPKLMRLHFLAAMEKAIEHLGWESFIFMGHSMGCEQGLFFNVVHPGMITKMILLDAGPTLMRMQIEDPAEYQRVFYDSYYENYHWENFKRKSHTRTSALAALKRIRDLTEAQAEGLLERNFHVHEQKTASAEKPSEPQTSSAANAIVQRINEMREQDPRGYLSWDNRLKHLAPQNYGSDYYYKLFKTVPPTLLISASDGAKRIDPKLRPKAEQLIKKLMNNVHNFHIAKVEGGHDVHYTNPERVAPYILKFLEGNYSKKMFCKL